MSADEMDNENKMNQDDNGGDDGGDENYEDGDVDREPSGYEILSNMMKAYSKYEHIHQQYLYIYPPKLVFLKRNTTVI